MANIYDLTDTWSDGNTTYTSIKMNVTNTASSAASKLIDLQVGSSSLFSVDKDGKIADATELQVDNVKLDGNTVSSTTGNLVLDPYSGSKISLDGLLWPNADGTANQMLQTDGAGNLSWGTPAAGYSNADVDAHLNTSGATTNQVLSWTGSDYAWTAQTVAFGTADVDAHLNQSNPTSGYVLSWNGSDYAWVAQTGGSSYGDSDVDTHLNRSTATTGQLLSWNGTDYDWITSSAGGGSYADSDVDAHLNRSSATSGQVLGWNGTDYAWVANSGGSSYTDADVNTHLNQSTAQTNEVLSWNGTDYDWVAQTAAYTDSSVDAHLHRRSATSGQVLGWNGTDYAWVAQTAAYTDSSVDTHLNRSSASSGQILSYNGTDYAWIADAGITDVVSDTTPQLGGNLDLNSRDITGTGNIDITGNATLTGYLAGPATFTIDPAAVGDNTGTVVIAGDLQVDGTTTTINSTTLTVDDLNIVVASGAPNAAAADGAGLTVDTANATFTYAATGDKWTANKPLDLGANDLLADHIKATGDGTNNGKLDLQCSAGTHAVTLEGPDHTGASSYTLQLPQAAPGAGQVLAQNSGNTQLEFIDVLKPANIIDNLTSTSTTDALSAAQGKALQDNKQAAISNSSGTINAQALTTAVGGTDVDVRRAKVETPTTSADFAGDARLYNVATTGLTFTMDDTALNEGDIITLYANGFDVTIAQDATNGFDTVKLDGTTTAHSGNITVANGSIATISVISTTGGSSLAVVAGQGLS